MCCCMKTLGYAPYKIHLYPCTPKDNNICFIFFLFQLILTSVRVFIFAQLKWFLFFVSVFTTVLPFNLAALKNWVLATTKRLALAFFFISASFDPQGGSLCACLRCLGMGDCARALCVWLSSPLLAALKSAWQFGSMGLAPQELPSDKMSPWLCSTRPIGWLDAPCTCEPDRPKQGARSGEGFDRNPVNLAPRVWPYFVNHLPFILIDKISFDGLLN